MKLGCSNYSERQVELVVAVLEALIERHCNMDELNDIICYVPNEAAAISIIGSVETTNQ